MESVFAIRPTPTDESRPFWEACNRGELLLRRCERCRRPFHFPRFVCPRCGGEELGWQSSAGEGTLYSFSHVEVSFYGPQWEAQIPYTPVLVDLDEGVRMLSRLVGPGRDRARIGDRVRVAFVEFEGQKLPFFTLARA